MVEATPTKKAVATTKKARVQVVHPKTSEMVLAAIGALKERKGSSLQAIKKHVVANNKVEAARIAIFIRKFLKKAVAEGILVQTKGNGASGSFKLADTQKEAVVSHKKVTTSKKAPTAAKKAMVTPKKAAASKKSSTALKKKKQQLAVANKKPKVKRASKSPKPPKAKKAGRKTKAKK